MEYDSELKLWDKRAAIHKPPRPAETRKARLRRKRRPGARQTMSALGAEAVMRKAAHLQVFGASFQQRSPQKM